ncbi:MAG: UDP-N-acetylmuramate dehydrogenase, partial [Candidatus Kryptoniota bacterium]
PGLTGATPIQNVGAYGQEVSDTIEEVTVLDRSTKSVFKFNGSECGFGYRTSRFKLADKGRFIIIGVGFALRKHGAPLIKYPELLDQFKIWEGRTKVTLNLVRSAVLTLRKKKSMILDPDDPNSKSVGSFFVNPVLNEGQFRTFMAKADELGVSDKVPIFPVKGGVKISAAWLVENAGFHRGFRKGGVGISANHALALVNFGGTTSELIGLATEIREKVMSIFGIKLEIEPLVLEE